MVYAATTHKYIFDYHPGDVYYCTADLGWVTGHSYIMYGPLCNGATSVLFEGIPTWPDAGRFWAIVQKYKVTQFYTAPTAIRYSRSPLTCNPCLLWGNIWPYLFFPPRPER